MDPRYATKNRKETLLWMHLTNTIGYRDANIHGFVEWAVQYSMIKSMDGTPTWLSIFRATWRRRRLARSRPWMIDCEICDSTDFDISILGVLELWESKSNELWNPRTVRCVIRQILTFRFWVCWNYESLKVMNYGTVRYVIRQIWLFDFGCVGIMRE